MKGSNKEELDANHVCNVLICIMMVIKCKSYMCPLCQHVEFVTLITDLDAIFGGSQVGCEKPSPYA